MKWKKSLSVLLSTVMAAGYAVPAFAQEDQNNTDTGLSFEKTGLKPDLKSTAFEKEDTQKNEVNPDEVLRVSIVLEGKPVLDAGFSENASVAAVQGRYYQKNLLGKQKAVTQAIESKVLGGEKLDVVWNLTYAVNAISANVKAKDIAEIEKLDGVAMVTAERRYEPTKAEQADPNMSIASGMTGGSTANAAGYKGEGQRIAIIDTGTDTDHQSFDADAFEYALEQTAKEKGMDVEAYKETLDLLDAEEIAEKLPYLHAYERTPDFTADQYFVNGKLAFGYNYIDTDLDITHDNDSQGEHGSHVAGISTANEYVPDGNGGYDNALQKVKVQGEAPNAQLLTLKVFGKGGGAYDGDYMAAIEDAIVLGCDSVNLSLGSASAGNGYEGDYYQAVMDSLVNSQTAVVISAGNSYSWPEYAQGIGYLKAEDVSLDTVGSPGSYTNAFTVASVDNDGFTGEYLKAFGKNIFYTQTAGSNKPISSLSGEYDLVLIDGIGTDEEFAALEGVLKGKIAACSRGTTSFYQKANAAVANGAAAVLIYNNQPGTINMSLDGYSYTNPCVALTQADGAFLKENSEKKTTENGAEYYLGKIEIGQGVESDVYNQDTYTMSNFSSYGVPGSLEMKPEITAPGGNIYSVNGAVAGGTAYENMSGTSMAAPQITGLSAVLNQKLEEPGNPMAAKESRRFLMQSLLMSTAAPLIEADSGSYWSVLKQGSGLVNVAAAINSDSYLKMHEDATDSWADGKVKAELKDDAKKEGKYSFGFDLNNASDKDHAYSLSTDLMTQDLFEYEDGEFMDTWTVALDADVVYTVNGKEFKPVSGLEADVNQDGATDSEDAKAILEYLVSNVDSESISLEAADVDGNGEVNAWDAHEILATLETETFSVPAGTAADVQVSIAFSDELKARLNDAYENGAWIEGFTYVHSAADEEGQQDSEHSIPILGFYGDYSDASMTDHTSYAQNVYGAGDESYLGETATNGLSVRNAAGGSAWYVANPYGVEASYPEDKAAMRSDTVLNDYTVSLIRNAKALAVVVEDENGTVKDVRGLQTNVDAAYYYANGGYWSDTIKTVSIDKSLKDMGFKEGQKANIYVAAIPEYLIEKGAEINNDTVRTLMASGAVSKKNMLKTSVIVDDTAPELKSVHKNLMDGSLLITASDDNAIAAVTVMSPSGAKEFGRVLPQADGNDATVTVPVNSKQVGDQILVCVADYAGNETSYLVEYKGDKEIEMGGMYAFTPTAMLGKANTWMKIDPAALNYESAANHPGLEAEDYSDQVVAAADYTDGYVFYADQNGMLYSASQKEIGLETVIASLKNYGIETVRDMSWDDNSKSLYVLDAKDCVWNVSPLTGRAKRAFNIKGASASIVSFTADGHGTFYGAGYGSPYNTYLYEWKYNPSDYAEDEIADVQAVKKESAIGSYVREPGALEWDENTQTLYLAAMYNKTGPDRDNSLWKINTETGTGELTNTEGTQSRFKYNVCGLYVVQGTKDGADYQPTDTVGEITLDQTSHEMYPDADFKLTASVLPWTVTDRSVVWSSSDPEVASVADGVVTSHKPGDAVITATAAADASKTASCDIHVRELPAVDVTALIEKDGKLMFADLNTGAPAEAEAVKDAAAGIRSATLTEGKIYTEKDGYITALDPDTLKEIGKGTRYVGSWNASAPAEKIGDYFGGAAYIGSSGSSLNTYNLDTDTISFFTVLGARPSKMSAMCYKGQTIYRGDIVPCYYVLDEKGDLFEISLETSTWADAVLVGSTGLNLKGLADDPNQYSSALYYDDEAKVLILAVNGEKTNGWYVIDPENMTMARMGDLEADHVRAMYSYARPDDLLIRTEGEPGILYPGFTWQINARVILGEDESAMTYTSSDENIAVVDENGLVTGIDKGEADITIQSKELRKDGQPATAVVHVEVGAKEKLEGEAQFRAYLPAEEGGDWISLSLDANGVQSTVLAHTDLQIKAGGGNFGRVVGTKATGEYGDPLYILDPENGYASTIASGPSGTAVVDAAYAPRKDYTGFITYGKQVFEGEFFGNSILITADGSFRFVYDNGSGSGWSLNGTNKPVAICYAGETAISGYNMPAQTFYVLYDNGDLIDAFLYPRSNSDTLSCDIFTFKLGNIGMTFDNNKTYSMTAADIEGNDNVNLFIADSSRGKADLYHLEITEFNWSNASTFEYGYIGTLEGAEGISALHSWEEPEDSGQSLSAELLETADRPEAIDDAAETEEEKAVQADGSLQAVSAGSDPADEVQKGAVVIDKENNTITVNINAEDSAAGQFELAYDAALLQLDHVSTPRMSAWSDQDDIVQAAFASAKPASKSVMKAVFTYDQKNERGLSTALSLNVTEDGQNETLPEPVKIQVEIPRDTTEMNRLYNPNSGEHFYTGDEDEANGLVRLGWKHEGSAWEAPNSSNTPVYRLYNPNAGDHHYTIDAEERDHLISEGWKDEGTGWYSDDEQGVPVYRAYNPNARKAGSHHYTTDKKEIEDLVKAGWRDEGICWYGVK